MYSSFLFEYPDEVELNKRINDLFKKVNPPESVYSVNYAVYYTGNIARYSCLIIIYRP